MVQIIARLCRAALVAVVFFAGAPVSAEPPAHEPLRGTTSVAGRLLIATERMPSPMFAKTVVLMIEHDAKGAYGLIINRIIGRGSLRALIKPFGVDVDGAEGEVNLHIGGPVDMHKPFILHDTGYKDEQSRPFMEGVAVSNHRAIIEDIGHGKGPENWFLILGYSGWAPGQLEQELARGDWVSAPAKAERVFSREGLENLWADMIKGASVPL